MIRELMLAGALITPVAGGAVTPTKPPHVKPIVTAKPAQHTPQDYYVPLERWLKRHGSPLSGRDFWEIGRQYHIDPDVLIAITAAETSLGRTVQRGVPCNVGSVGSYDSTNTTMSCSSRRHGIELIARTLNNAKLGHKTTLAQLSRATEPYGAVYASSTGNWIRNVRATLTSLKGHDVGIQYRFRR